MLTNTISQFSEQQSFLSTIQRNVCLTLLCNGLLDFTNRYQILVCFVNYLGKAGQTFFDCTSNYKLEHSQYSVYFTVCYHYHTSRNVKPMWLLWLHQFKFAVKLDFLDRCSSVFNFVFIHQGSGQLLLQRHD